MSEQAVVFLLVAGAGYLLWCARFPYTACPRCGGKTKAGDGRGNYRIRRQCWCCGNRPYPRLGARLMGRGRKARE